MMKYVMLNVNSVLNSVRYYLTDIFCLCLYFDKIMIKEQYYVNA